MISEENPNVAVARVDGGAAKAPRYGPGKRDVSLMGVQRDPQSQSLPTADNADVTPGQGDCQGRMTSMLHLTCGWLSQVKHVACKDRTVQAVLCWQIMIRA